MVDGLCLAWGIMLVGGARARVGSARVGLARAREGQARAVVERDRLRAVMARREGALVERGRLIERLQRSRQAEREWNRELRAQLERTQVTRGALGEDADVRELVLRAAIELVEAEKGLLLSRSDENGDGELDLVCALGFSAAAGHSELAQRFAREVIERDRIVREDSPARSQREADGEIDNLVAIPLYLRERFSGVIVCANRPGGFKELEDDVLLALGDHAGAALHTQRLENQLTHAHRSTLETLAALIEAYDPLAHREGEEAAVLTRMLARRMNVPTAEQETIAAAARLRDVAQITTPERILLKPGPLTPEERSIIELHPRTGARVIAHTSALDDIAQAVLYHHERYDGTGYPTQLAGTNIPLAARILAIADAYTALTHERPYRAAHSPEDALAELTAAAGSHLDPELTQLFLEELRAGTPSIPPPAHQPPPRHQLTTTDPLTLLPGHRAFREAAHQVSQHQPITVALIQIEGLHEENTRHGYNGGDQIILRAARNAQRAAQRTGAQTYRDSGRRIAILQTPQGDHHTPDLAHELHIEYALGPPVTIALATTQPGEAADQTIQRARQKLSSTIITQPE